jgi:hypothetical protein
MLWTTDGVSGQKEAAKNIIMKVVLGFAFLGAS